MNKCQIKIGGRAWAMWQCERGKDALGYEPDEMLKDRIERSFELASCPETYKGQRIPYEPRSGPVYLDANGLLLWEFENALQELCERFGVALLEQDEGPYSESVTIYLEKNSPEPRSEIVIDPRVRDASVYREESDGGPDGPREGFDE